MKNRQELAMYFAKRKCKIGAEIGVAKGVYSELLCQTIPNLKLFCIDAWQAYPGYRDYARQKTLDNMYKEAQQRLLPYDCQIIKAFSVQAAKIFPDGFFDFVYIDANHAYASVLTDIATWTQKVRVGGIISGHDYLVLAERNVGVKTAVDEYTKKMNYTLHVTEWDGKNLSDEETLPNWYFIKKT